MDSSVEQTFECDRCDEPTSIDDGVMLTKKHSKQYTKYLCGSCLADIGVPTGYELERDLSHIPP